MSLYDAQRVCKYFRMPEAGFIQCHYFDDNICRNLIRQSETNIFKCSFLQDKEVSDGCEVL